MASLDVRLAQLLELLVLYRAEHSQRPVVPRGQDAKALAVKLDARRGRAMPGSESKEPTGAVGVVEDPLLERVVGASRHQHRLAEEEVRLGHGAVVHVPGMMVLGRRFSRSQTLIDPASLPTAMSGSWLRW